MKYRHILLILISTLGLLACANQAPPKASLHAVFTPQIRPNGLKRFTFTVVDLALERSSITRYREKELERGTKSLDETRRKMNLKTVQKKKLEEITTLLDAKIAENGYCREGYTVANFYNERNRSEIQGECNESAEIEDREKFLPVGPGGSSSAQPGVISDKNVIIPN
jgi:hypothetical protein